MSLWQTVTRDSARAGGFTAFGLLRFYIGLAIGLSTWLRPHIGYVWWRRLHVLTLLLYVLVVVMGLRQGAIRAPGGGCAVCDERPAGRNPALRTPDETGHPQESCSPITGCSSCGSHSSGHRLGTARPIAAGTERHCQQWKRLGVCTYSNGTHRTITTNGVSCLVYQ
jgi:hypothetical protein